MTGSLVTKLHASTLLRRAAFRCAGCLSAFDASTHNSRSWPARRIEIHNQAGFPDNP
jgi:hypothetical protein